MNEKKNNPFACNRLYNDIFHPEYTEQDKRNTDIATFLRFLSKPREEKEVVSYLNMMLKSENVRAYDEMWKNTEPEKIYLDEEKKTMAVLWKDGTKTKSKCAKEDAFDFKVGFVLCLAKHVFLASNNEFSDIVEDYKNKIVVPKPSTEAPKKEEKTVEKPKPTKKTATKHANSKEKQ